MALKQAGAIDPEEIMKIASEGGEIQAVEVSKLDQRRLARLKAKAGKSKELKVNEIVTVGEIN